MARDGLLTFEDGVIRLGGDEIPGVLHSLSVGCEVRFDEAEQDAMSGKTRTPLGWGDAAVTVILDLLTDATSCYAKLAVLNGLFKGYDNGSNPKVYDVVNPHLVARGVRQVVFSGLTSQESDSDDVIQANLKFDEHRPAIVQVERREASKGSAPAIDAAPVTSSSSISTEGGGR
ncbi:MAG: hypothetical protein KKE73_09755 [Proteobacteria bacterium]|nr:hypothetical protein [Pseudomonadota bacterium]